MAPCASILAGCIILIPAQIVSPCSAILHPVSFVFGGHLARSGFEVLRVFAFAFFAFSVSPQIRVFGFRKKDEITRNVVYSVSAPKTKFCRRLFQN